jgi:hypothetical protein
MRYECQLAQWEVKANHTGKPICSVPELLCVPLWSNPRASLCHLPHHHLAHPLMHTSDLLVFELME